MLQLGSVDKEYSTALEVAMGGRMKNIVVDDVDVARVCIDYLKSARAGSATFLPLDKMKPAPSSLKLPKEKGVIDYAINLIDFDDKYLDAFFYALGDTLIVEDYDSAKRLIGKFRLVTLDGSLFEKSGAIMQCFHLKNKYHCYYNDCSLSKRLKALRQATLKVA